MARIATGRNETPEERSDRNWNELLQELRVMQTGTQILTGFLLTLPFQSRFTELDDFQVTTYLVLVVLAVATTIVVVAPVSLHRLLFRRHLKSETVTIGDRILKIALGFLGLVVTGVVLLVFDVVTTRGVALAVAGAVAIAVLVAWLTAPMRLARRNA
ncbi:MAG: sodium:proton antiporter [Actinobacteria bacterium]|nr:sodium:proton antiporter [Actinomycetota bacterium]